MSPVFSSPRSGPPAAATTPARLFEEFGGQARWRQIPGRGVEVATLRDGVLEVHLVRDDGTTVLEQAIRPTPGYRYGRRMAAAGGVPCLCALAVYAATQGEGAGSPVAAALFFGGVAVALAGLFLRARGEDIDLRLKSVPGRGEDWKLPTNLHGWTPRTAEQLATIEQMADDHDGLALVRDVGGKTVEVCVLHNGHFGRYWVDERGEYELIEERSTPLRYLLDRILRGAFILLWLALLGVGFRVTEHKGKALLAVLAAIGVVMLLGWINDSSQTLKKQARKAGDHPPWIEIWTRVPDDGE